MHARVSRHADPAWLLQSTAALRVRRFRLWLKFNESTLSDFFCPSFRTRCSVLGHSCQRGQRRQP